MIEIDGVRRRRLTDRFPFWSRNDRPGEDELRAQIRNMKDLGMGGFFMHARGGLETEHLGEEWFSCVRACIDEAKKCGMEAYKRGAKDLCYYNLVF